MFYKTLIKFCLLFVVGFFALAGQAQAASLQLSPSSGSFATGNNFNVNIYLSISGESVDGVDALLNFNSSVLEVNAITTGSLFATYPTNTYNNTAGTISVSALAQTGSPVTASGTVATINFQAKAAGTGTATFDFTAGLGTDSNVAQTQTGNDILTSVTNGSYTISSSGTSQSPSPSPTSGVGGGTQEALPVTGNQSLTIVLLAGGMIIILLGLGWRLAHQR